MRNLLLGAVGGMLVTALAAYLLYAAPERMQSSQDGVGEEGARYVVGKERFDWFYPSRGPAGYHPNCWGGHTLDGRCISLVGVSGWYYVNAYNDPIAKISPRCSGVEHECDSGSHSSEPRR